MLIKQMGDISSVDAHQEVWVMLVQKELMLIRFKDKATIPAVARFTNAEEFMETVGAKDEWEAHGRPEYSIHKIELGVLLAFANYLEVPVAILEKEAVNGH